LIHSVVVVVVMMMWVESLFFYVVDVDIVLAIGRVIFPRMVRNRRLLTTTRWTKIGAVFTFFIKTIVYK